MSYGGMVQGQRSEELQVTPEAARAYATKIPTRQGATMKGVPFDKHAVVRVGSIGVGGRGAGQLREMLAVASFGGAQIVAIADRDQGLIDAALKQIADAGQPTGGGARSSRGRCYIWARSTGARCHPHG